ncbi:PREDICTED: cytochrome P450 2J2-like [Mesitornis unicolor]|uniref:cytochrome P450 2J2-like n=1 Tax=Mesitornis unicolor TaxID=54374 RepID=UPI00052809FD|nr:PREDICTED: cytochrome P450 2J2-like [Mesitornis unicolor]
MELQFWPDLIPLTGRTLLVVLVTVLLIADLVRKRRPRNFPPGPQLFPLVGTIVDFKQPLHLALQKLTSQYGNIFSVQFGSLTFVVVNGYQMVREALVQQAEIFADRPNIPLLQEIFRGFGLISSNGHIWRQQRKFASATLKSISVSFEEKVQEESRYLVETMEEEKGQPFDPHYKINSAVSNIICSITFGNRFDYHDNRFQELLHSLAETLLLLGSFWGQLYNAFPLVMRWLPGPFRKIFSHWEKLQYFVKGVIAKHKEDLDHSEAGDYIYCYLKEIEKGDTSSYFHEENLLCSTLDLFLTGTETTATAIRWALLYMAAYPNIQEKVQFEIDTVIGQSRQPTMADKENMPYTSAVLSEVLRMGNIVPLGVPRMSTSDTTLAGFHLPKGTTLMTSLTSIMFDKNMWESPDTFNPEHFLENGQYRRREAFLPFSAGKRACPGEQLARTELFIFFTALLQKFTFQAPAASKLTFAFTLSLTRCPKPFQIHALPRD